jgi:hypothetical protein
MMMTYTEESWQARLIRRGVEEGDISGTESSAEALLVHAAASTLKNGEPALELLSKFSLDELAGIKKAMDELGPEGWYYPLKRRK